MDCNVLPFNINAWKCENKDCVQYRNARREYDENILFKGRAGTRTQ
jgi:hypothetical protein